MKCVVLAAVPLLTVIQGATEALPANSYGPQGCVSLERSPSGTCVLRTNCSAVNTSRFEYEFDCVSAGREGEGVRALRHSYGLGGFDPVEVFDTGVPCQQCLPPRHTLPLPSGAPRSRPARLEGEGAVPLPPPSSSPKLAQAHVTARPPPPALPVAHTTGAAAEHAAARPPAHLPAPHALAVLRAKEAEAPPGILDPSWSSEVSRYGPQECVSTWKSKRGHCIVRTECKGVNTTGYDFGMVCVDKEDVPTRHYFGKNSFKAAETFDTKVECERCIGLGTMSKEMRLRGTVASIMREVGGLKGEMLKVSKSLSKLDMKVFPKTSAAKPSVGAKPHGDDKKDAASSKPTEPEEAQPVLVHHKSRRASYSTKHNSHAKMFTRKERVLKLRRHQKEKMRKLEKKRQQKEREEQEHTDDVEQQEREMANEEEEEEEELENRQEQTGNDVDFEEEEDEEQDEAQEDAPDEWIARDQEEGEQLQAEDAQALEERRYEKDVEEQINARKDTTHHRKHHLSRYHQHRHHRPAHGFMDAREKAFRLLDADGSGTVSASEWARSVSVVGRPQGEGEGRVTIMPEAS